MRDRKRQASRPVAHPLFVAIKLGARIGRKIPRSNLAIRCSLRIARRIVALGKHEIETLRRVLHVGLVIRAPIRNALAVAALVAIIGSAGVMLVQLIAAG